MPEKTISVRNTKHEIIGAYNQLLKEVKEMKRTSRKEEAEKEKGKELVKAAQTYLPNQIIKNLTDTKLKIIQYFEEITDQMVEKHKKLTEIQKAINITEEDLKQRYEISVNANTLDALLLGQKQKSEEFEQKIAEKKAQWEKEQEVIQTERKREKDQYDYELKLQRRKDQDQYEIKKGALEKELSERQAIVATQEKEFTELKTTVEKFPEKLAQAVEAAKKEAVKELETKYKFETELRKKEIEGTQKLNQQIIAAQKAKIQEMEQQIMQLTKKASEANQQVQDIAVKAIEGASRITRAKSEYPERIVSSRSNRSEQRTE